MKPWQAFIITAGIGSYLAITAAGGHEAASGWEYPRQCCSDNDCAEIPAEWVEYRGDGYQVTIPAGGHPSVIDEPFSAFVSETAAPDKIKPSPDERWHVCIGPKTKVVFCLYIVRSYGV